MRARSPARARGRTTTCSNAPFLHFDYCAISAFLPPFSAPLTCSYLGAFTVWHPLDREFTTREKKTLSSRARTWYPPTDPTHPPYLLIIGSTCSDIFPFPFHTGVSGVSR